jgi:Glycosyl hydrolases family 39
MDRAGYTRRALRGRRATPLMLVAGAIVLASLLGFERGPAGPQRVAVVKIDSQRVLGTSRLRLGVTHTEHSADSGNSSGAVARARTLLRSVAVFQNQHIMGWGALNPEPSPGHYDFASLDARVALMRSTGAIPVITLCCAPDWMKGGRSGQTDWSKLAEAPSPSHFADFARLAARVAARYPDVRYFQVWNELKGFYDSSRDRYDYERYTRLYNDVYDAVKAVRPDAKIGGPYVVMASWSADATPAGARSALGGPYGIVDQRALDVIKYWLVHKHGADFITLDATSVNKGGSSVGAYTGAQKFADVAGWLRRLPAAQYPGARTLPLWWAEWKVQTSPPSHDLAYLTSVMASGLARTLRSGASVALIWGAEGDSHGIASPEAIWTSTRSASGGGATPLAAVLRGFRMRFPPGTRIVQTTSTSRQLEVLASASNAMLINHSSYEKVVDVDGRTVTLPGYGVLFTTLRG